MASIEKRGNTYRIIVSCGYDDKGHKVRHTMTWKPDDGMTSRQIQKAVQRAAADFERSIELGYQPDCRLTFAEYAEYVLQQKLREGVKPRTLERYRSLLDRIIPAIGHLKLVDIRPQHLNRFYDNLGEPGIRKGSEKAIAKESLTSSIKKQGLTGKALAESAGVSASTISAALHGRPITAGNAASIAKALTMDYNTVFKPLRGKSSTLSTKTILEHHRLISTILATAEKEMLVPYNAAEKASPPTAPRPEPGYFQPQEIGAILRALDTEPLMWQCLVTLLIVTGCRRGEIIALKWSKVSFDLARIKIDRALLYTKSLGLYEDSTKTSDVRYLRIPDEALELLRQWKCKQTAQQSELGDYWKNTEDYVFTRPDGLPLRPDSVTGWLSRFSKRHNLPHINPHAFRHTVASVLISNGTDVVTVSKQLGHASITTTESFYAHVIAERQAEAAQCISDVLLHSKDA